MQSLSGFRSTAVGCLLAVSLLSACSNNASPQASEDGANTINTYSAESNLQFLLNDFFVGREILISFAPAGPTQFGINHSTVGAVSQDWATSLRPLGVNITAQQLTDVIHTALIDALEDSWSDLAFDGRELLSTGTVCDYHIEFDLAFDQLNTVGLIIDNMTVDIDPTTDELRLTMDFSNLLLSSHVIGDIDIIGGGLCPNFSDDLDDPVTIRSRGATLDISLQFDNGFGTLFPGCREPIVDSIVTLESASFSGITAELPTIEVSFLSIDVDLDDHVTGDQIRDALNDALATELPKELAREQVRHGVAAATDVYFLTHTGGSDYVTFDWEVDWDGDGRLYCDECPEDIENDQDNDDVCENTDNCPMTPNRSQKDNDQDGAGDACDGDDDNDGVPDTADNCQFVANRNQVDWDRDGVGNACDNCVHTPNPAQWDFDDDGHGNACDQDDDNDGIIDDDDNCPIHYNPSQRDSDNDGFGDVCDEFVDKEYLQRIVSDRFQALIQLLRDAGVGEGPWGPWKKLVGQCFSREDDGILCTDEMDEANGHTKDWKAGYNDTMYWMKSSDWPKNVYKEDVVDILCMDKRLVADDVYQYFEKNLSW